MTMIANDDAGNFMVHGVQVEGEGRERRNSGITL
jgi:hypothetical protein